MESKNFINYHVLISHNPSCLNRDDQNMQKIAIFGGVRRVRYSSQCLKRAMRHPPENAYNYWGKELGAPSYRTRNLEKVSDLLFNELKSDFDPDLIKETIERFTKTSSEENESDDGNSENETEETAEKSKGKIAVAPWVINEIRELCRIIRDAKQAPLSDKEQESLKKQLESQGKKKKQRSEKDLMEEIIEKRIQKAVKDSSQVIMAACSTAIDVALFGRMATSGLMTSIDGSLAVAHAITTHEVDNSDIDWFTAVDDLVKQGSGHLDTQEFSSGVFYRYASLNLKQLQVNLGLIKDVKAEETPQSRNRALEIAKHVFHMLTTVVPSAKQQSCAAHNPADFAIVSFADQPISLANAFESPVKNNSGFLFPSINGLKNYWDTINGSYALNENGAVFNPRKLDLLADISEEKEKKSSELNHLCNFDKLPDVEKWIVNDGIMK